MPMPVHVQRAAVRLVCRRCRYGFDLCVPVTLTVPHKLCCPPVGGGPALGSGSAGGLRCPKCDCSRGLTDADLRRRVEDELRYGRRQSQGKAVVLDCV